MANVERRSALENPRRPRGDDATSLFLNGLLRSSVGLRPFGTVAEFGFRPQHRLAHAGGFDGFFDVVYAEDRRAVHHRHRRAGQRAGQSIARLAESSSTKITGRVHWVAALEDAPGSAKRVGRFGWKCQIATVLSFSASAATNELGFTNHLLPTEAAPNGNRALLEKCDSVPDPEDRPDSSGFTYVDRVTHFQRYLAAPPQTPRSGMRGEQVFDRIGCAACHVPAWRTADDPSLEAALRHRLFKPYSDFLLHDMGRLGDGIVQGDATGREFRTTPLWGFRFRFPVLHDGRVSGVTSAERAIRCIEAHDGEAEPSVRAYRELGKQERNQLIAFLDSLGRVEFDQDGDNDVDLNDWSFFVGCSTRPAEGKYSPDDRCRIVDIDGDGDVDLVDFALLQQAFTGSLYGSVMAVP